MEDKYYILDGKKVKTADLISWARWFETADRVVKQETLLNGYYISTVFLGVNHNFGPGKPLLFETMVFKSKGNMDDQDMDRYSTWEEAEAGHEKMVKKWKRQNYENIFN